MTTPGDPGYRPNLWGTGGDHEKRIQALEALDCCVPTGVPTLDEVIAGLSGLDAWWKLNESSGSVAADSSGNGYDLSNTTGTDPTWGQAAGPPGEQSAGFSANTQVLNRTHHTSFVNDFTAFGWVYRSSAAHFDMLMGQGLFQSSVGWTVAVDNSNSKLTVIAGAASVVSDATIPATTWTMWAVKRDATVWSLYLDGVPQSAHMTTAPSPSTALWIVNNSFNLGVSSLFLSGRDSYNALVARALSDDEIATIFTAAGAAGTESAGMVLTSDGVGGSTYWAYPVSTWVNGA